MTVPVEPANPAFTGFPRSGEATVIPNTFFSRVLPEIESPEELVVTTYVFFLQGVRRRRPPFVTSRELAADPTLARALSRLSAGSEDAVARGLDLAVRRRTLLRAKVRSRETGDVEDLYVVNNPPNREALERLGAEGAATGEYTPLAKEASPPNIFALYEQNIGPITPLIEAELRDAEKHYAADWVREAFREAAELNKRSWRYIERILQRWETEGPNYEKPERDSQADWLAKRYREGKERRPYTTAP